MRFSEKPYIIIGSGIAGLYTAIKLSEKTAKQVLLITKSDLRESNSRYAQGGIVGVLPENTQDSVALHVKDTLKAGAGLTDKDVAEFISKKSAESISDLIQYGVKFDRASDQQIELTLEGAHSTRRILHSGGDATGRNIERTLSDKVESNPRIQIYRKTVAVDLLVDSEKTCRGVIVLDETTGEYETIYSSAVIIATGGAGQVYSNTTNPSIATGDGIVLAYRAGATVQNMEFIQFHPTALNFEENGSRFLISESVRGEGAKLKNLDGEYFTDSLAPRDVVTRAIFFEMQEKGYDYVLLDATCLPEEQIKARFPNILNVCLEHEIDIIREPIPVSPAAHYIMGGIKTSVHGETSIKGLYSVGEAACTSFHGANRLASNSLLECVVVANELAETLSKQDISILLNKDCQINCLISQYEKNHFDLPQEVLKLKKTLRETMWKKAGIVRDEQGLKEALKIINELKLDFDQEYKCRNLEEYEFRSLLTVAELIIRSSLLRKESRGAHFREDYPETKDEAHNSYLSKESICIPSTIHW
ncbi:MAG: L-aspartate oxidase [Candidatus Melainabacteria bacterium GWF2_37_15]|nr:MAG: L-aspartate oxidase [Candidatus Melainabacteria bacterium GWF2_37_15]